MPPSQDPMNSVPAQAAPVAPPSPIAEKSSSPQRTWMLLAGIAAIVVIGAAIYWFAPQKESASVVPKKIGIANFVQGSSSVTGLKKGLAELGYSDVEFFGGEVIPNPKMIEEIKAIYRKAIEENDVDLLFADHEHQALAAVEITREMGVDVPIVFISRFHDPVSYGIVESFKSSGNNATGITQNLTEVASRIYNFLREINPSLKKVGVFGEGFLIPGLADDDYFPAMKDEADRLGIELIEYKSSAPPPQAEAEFNRVADSIKKGDIDGIFHLPGHFFESQQVAEYQLAKRLGIPMHAPYEDLGSEGVEGGGHFAYTANFAHAGEQAARMVDKIFRGMKPSEIPLEYGEQNLLVLEKGRAEETGIKFSESMLFLADEVRE